MEYPKRETLQMELYQDLKKTLLEYHSGLFEIKKNEDEGDLLIQKLYLDPQEGCVPDEFIGEELLYAVKSKFYAIFSVIRDKVQVDYLEKKKISYPPISIAIEASYEDVTYVVVSFQNAVISEYNAKAWNFVWTSSAELQKEMADLFYQMRDRLNQYFVEGLRYAKQR
ncbi:MAG TPA: hypothetical protein PKV84_01600 [Candidatus Omnitrophota bacterium]|nr:hypothetical protein [Candidatus Omnitrophota bacterium]